MANSNTKPEITGLDNMSVGLFDWNLVNELAKNMKFVSYVGKGHRNNFV